MGPMMALILAKSMQSASSTRRMARPSSTASTTSMETSTTASRMICKDWVATTKDGTNFIEKGGMGEIDNAVGENGVVLVMSLWDDHYANMLWLDSTYPVDSSDPGAVRGSCATTSGAPDDVEKEQGSSKVMFSDIRWGPLGSTTDGPS